MPNNHFDNVRDDFERELVHLADSMRRSWEKRPCIYIRDSGIYHMNTASWSMLGSMNIDPLHVVEFAREGSFFQKLHLNGLDMELTKLPDGALMLALAENRKSGHELFTPKETEVLLYLVKGLTNKEIAEKMGLSPGTVNTHLDNLYRKLGCSNRIKACLTALAMGLCREELAIGR